MMIIHNGAHAHLGGGFNSINYWLLTMSSTDMI